VIFVGKKPSSGKKFIITEIKQKIRLLNVITSFIIITLMSGMMVEVIQQVLRETSFHLVQELLQ
jgi:hypothetical protein